MTDGSQLGEPVSVPTQPVTRRPGSRKPDADYGRSEPGSCQPTGNGDGVALYEDGVLRIVLVEEPLGLRLIGQADLSHRGIIEQALRRVEQSASDVLVDLSQLELIDVGGARQVIDHAGVLGMDGRSVQMTGLSPGVLRIFQVCLWPKPPNLSIEDAGGNDPASTSRRSPDPGGDESRVPSR